MNFISNNTLNDNVLLLRLNNDCLLHILMFLPIQERIRIQRVCKRFQEVSSLVEWHHIKLLCIGRNDFPEKQLNIIDYDKLTIERVLTLCGMFVTHIRFYHCSSSPPFIEILTLVRKMCPNLEFLHFHDHLFQHKEIEYLRDNYTDLKGFSFNSYETGCADVLAEFLLRNDTLQSVSVNRSSITTGYFFMCLDPKSITSISIKYCPFLIKSCLTQALRRFHRLENLTFYDIHRVSYCFDEFLEAIPDVSTLRTLRLKGIENKNMIIMETSRFKFMNHLINLQTLELDCTYLLSDYNLNTIAKNCKELSSVCLKNSHFITNVGIRNILSLPKLKYLELSDIENVTCEAFSGMLHLNLKSFRCIRCNKLETAAFSIVLQTCGNLTYLEMKRCKYVSNDLLVECAIIVANRRVNIPLTLCIESSNSKIEFTEVPRLLRIKQTKRLDEKIQDES